MFICKFCRVPCLDDAAFCHKCGTKIERQPESTQPKIPKCLTVKEAAQIFFQDRVSTGLIYAAVKEHRLPHVKMSNGKILLDVDELAKWWEEELRKSKVTVIKGGLSCQTYN